MAENDENQNDPPAEAAPVVLQEPVRVVRERMRAATLAVKNGTFFPGTIGRKPQR